MEDTTCGALDVYDSDDEFKIVKQKIEEEKNTGEDVEKSDETTLAKSYKYPDPAGQTGKLLVTLLILQCLPYAAGKSFDYGKQGLQEEDCGNFHSYLRNVTGPFSALSMCEIRRQNTQCPMEYIAGCFPFIENNTEYYFSCIINSTSLSILLNDGQCILVTKTEGSNDFLAQCYKRDDCLPGYITSPKPATTNFPHVTMGSTSPTLHWAVVGVLIIAMVCILDNIL